MSPDEPKLVINGGVEHESIPLERMRLVSQSAVRVSRVLEPLMTDSPVSWQVIILLMTPAQAAATPHVQVRKVRGRVAIDVVAPPDVVEPRGQEQLDWLVLATVVQALAVAAEQKGLTLPRLPTGP